MSGTVRQIAGSAWTGFRAWLRNLLKSMFNALTPSAQTVKRALTVAAFVLWAVVTGIGIAYFGWFMLMVGIFVAGLALLKFRLTTKKMAMWVFLTTVAMAFLMILSLGIFGAERMARHPSNSATSATTTTPVAATMPAAATTPPPPTPTTSPAPATPPVVTIVPTPAIIAPNGQFTLSIKTTDAATCSIPGIANVPCNGDISISITGTTIYTITAEGPGGKTTASTMVTVTTSSPSEDKAAQPQTETERARVFAGDRSTRRLLVDMPPATVEPNGELTFSVRCKHEVQEIIACDGTVENTGSEAKKLVFEDYAFATDNKGNTQRIYLLSGITFGDNYNAILQQGYPVGFGIRFKDRSMGSSSDMMLRLSIRWNHGLSDTVIEHIPLIPLS